MHPYVSFFCVFFYNFYCPVNTSVPIACIYYMEDVITCISVTSDRLNGLFVCHVKLFTCLSYI